jgi:hypothetical protein
MLATLAKARLSLESIKGLSLVAVRHMTNQMSIDSGCILVQYMNGKHNTLYKIWTADLRV